ncbi:MAG TPA: hypothetical protein VJN21_03330 [Candidatus Acidoferrales bacterium]|nr:hypothetical protein [Candidatus Acidoferrales bacterium]
MKMLSRIDPLSAMKVGGIIYGCMGLLIGVIFALFVSIGAMLGTMTSQQDVPFTGAAGVIRGMVVIIAAPILYGVLGALMAGLIAVLYNFIAHRFGGLMLEVRDSSQPNYGAPVTVVTS